ncbi:hypothetical protein I551_8802 [Mycobacterium ulcerans str. Harvey]|uniref:Uncharacterized protein n=1 Tax=Mycobacterium ulcerans str. Harvey TaxID=1299332 RepID=A0ABP3AV21_MYCUL|nr:hypothetical protein I551_8802 [Mycobacterium ulcerans str. Harvey]
MTAPAAASRIVDRSPATTGSRADLDDASSIGRLPRVDRGQ